MWLPKTAQGINTPGVWNSTLDMDMGISLLTISPETFHSTFIFCVSHQMLSTAAT